MAVEPPHPESHQHHSDRATVQEFIHEFWPIMLFAGLFVMMVSLPLIFTGFLTIQALLIISAFLVALALTFTAARFLGWYILALTLFMFIVQPMAWVKAPTVAFFYTLFILLGLWVLPQKKNEKKRSER